MRFVGPRIMLTRGISPGHYKNGCSRAFLLRRYVPFFGYIADFLNKIFNPLPMWDKVREMKKGHFPNGSSFKTFIHWSQIVSRGGQFQKFDYGPRKNMKLYGQRSAPVLDLANVKDVPIALFVGNRDGLATITDSHFLRKSLRNVLVFYKEYRANHITFQLGRNVAYFPDLL